MKQEVVIADHAELKRLYTAENISPREIRWALKLQEYNLKFEHRAERYRGYQRLFPAPYKGSNETFMFAMLSRVVFGQKEKLRNHMLADEDSSNIKIFLLDSEGYENIKKQAITKRSRHYEVVDEILFCKIRTKLNGYLRPFTPQSMRIEVHQNLYDFPN